MLSACDSNEPSSGLLPLQMTETTDKLVAAEVHFFDASLDLEPLKNEFAKLDDYLNKKRYRYVIYEPLLKYDMADDFIQYSSGLLLSNLTQSEIDADEDINYEPQRFVDEQEYQILRSRLANYFAMVDPYKNKMWQLNHQKQEHLDEMERLEKATEVNFNSAIKRQKLDIPPYRFISTPFAFKKIRKLKQNCESNLYQQHSLLKEDNRLDLEFCWYLMLPNEKFLGSEVELQHASLFKSYLLHYDALNTTASLSLFAQLEAAEQAYNEINLEALARFGVKTPELERLAKLESLLEKDPLKRSFTEKLSGGLRAMRFNKMHQMVKRYKAAITLTYLFNKSFKSNMAGVDGRFSIPEGAKFMLVYGLYGQSIEQAKEYFWFVNMKQALSGFENVELMTLPEKPKGETLEQQLDLVINL